MEQIAPTFSTSKGARVPDLIKTATTEIKASFLRAFWDDEGSISNRGDLTGASVSEPMIDDLIALHRALGIDSIKYMSSRIPKPVFYLIVRKNRANYQKFVERIGFEYATITKGHNIGKFKKDVLLEKYNERYIRGNVQRNV